MVAAPADVGHDLDRVEQHQPLGHQGFQLRQEGPDAVLLVDDDDRDRQVLRERQQAGGVDCAISVYSGR